jgi:hypothetical protein
MNGGVVLLDKDYNIRAKHSYRGHHYIMQSVLILKAVQVTYTVEHSSSFVRDTVPILNKHTSTMFAGRHMLRIVTFFPRSVN